MGFLENLKAKSAQFRSREFAHGSMAMCALIAAADGSIDEAEKRTTAELIATNEVLSIFDSAELLEIFDGYVTRLQDNYDLGKLEAYKAVAKLKGKREHARAMIQIGIVIGGADGIFDPYEQATIRNACKAVGLAPAEFDL